MFYVCTTDKMRGVTIGGLVHNTFSTYLTKLTRITYVVMARRSKPHKVAKSTYKYPKKHDREKSRLTGFIWSKVMISMEGVKSYITSFIFDIKPKIPFYKFINVPIAFICKL